MKYKTKIGMLFLHYHLYQNTIECIYTVDNTFFTTTVLNNKKFMNNNVQ